MSFSLKHRILLRDIDGAGLAQWAGSRTPNPRVPGSIPGRVGVIFSLFWGCLGMCLGVLLEGFRMVRARKKILNICYIFNILLIFPILGDRYPIFEKEKAPAGMLPGP